MSRFVSISDEEKARVLHERNAQNTHRATEVSWAVLLAYCSDRDISLDVNNVSMVELSKILQMFYFEIRKKDGKQYKKSAFRAIRSGIQRKIKDARNIDIVQDPFFTEANTAFAAQCVQLKKAGLAKIDHKPIISEEDMRKLYGGGAVFGLCSPKPLQRKVFFEILYFFCRRGLENIRQLTKDSFIVKKDSDGVEYVMQQSDELRKNSRGSRDDPQQDGGVMYATGEKNCPVKSFKLYLSKLNPTIDALFQRPKNVLKAFDPAMDVWYERAVIGVKMLENFMKDISVDARLSTIYTNHSIRATCITNLDNSGKEARHIMAVSGHKSESSIRSYARSSLGQKRKMSEVLLGTSSGLSEGSTPSKVTRFQPILPRPSNTIDQEDLVDFSSLQPSPALRPPVPKKRDAAERIAFELNGITLSEGDNRWASILGNNGFFNNCTFNFGKFQ